MTTDNIPPRLANAVLPAVLLESDLKPGLIVKAKWNGENATIKEVKDGNVYYNSAIWKKDTTFNDTVKVFLECFVPISDKQGGVTPPKFN